MLDLHAYGRIASDIEVKQSANGKHLYTNFLLASHNRGGSTFMRCTAFDAMATLLGEYFCKGDRIALSGELLSDDYNGSKYRFKLKVKEFEFVDTKAEHERNKEKHSPNDVNNKEAEN